MIYTKNDLTYICVNISMPWAFVNKTSQGFTSKGSTQIKKCACTSKMYKCVGVCMVCIKMQLTMESQKFISIWKLIIDSIPLSICMRHCVMLRDWCLCDWVPQALLKQVFVQERQEWLLLVFFWLVSASAWLPESLTKQKLKCRKSSGQSLTAAACWFRVDSRDFCRRFEHRIELLLIHWAIKHTSRLKKLRVFYYQTKGFALNTRACCSLQKHNPSCLCKKKKKPSQPLCSLLSPLLCFARNQEFS